MDVCNVGIESAYGKEGAIGSPPRGENACVIPRVYVPNEHGNDVTPSGCWIWLSSTGYDHAKGPIFPDPLELGGHAWERAAKW
jgi:hypothetical protein